MFNTAECQLLPCPEHEEARQLALEQLEVLDSPPEQAFDDLAWLASTICDTPIALVSLVDADRQWFKARCGLDIQQTPREFAFCAHAILGEDLLEIPDARADTRFARNPLVVGAPGIRFYAGAPLLGTSGHRYGTLCVIDTRPRRLDPSQREALVRLARRTTARLEARRQLIRAEAREQTLVRLLEAMPDGVVSCNADGLLDEFNKTAREWHGVDPRALPPREWASHFGLYEPDGSRALGTERIPLLRAWRGEVVREAEIVIRAGGQPPRTVLCNAEPLTTAEGVVMGAVCVMHDVTRLKAAQDAMQIEAARFSGAFTTTVQGMALVSLDGHWLEVNDALCTMFGYRRPELLELDFQRVTHPQDLQTDLELLAGLLAGRCSSYQLDKRYCTKDGRTIWAHLSVSLVRDAGGQPMHFVAQIQDFTDRRLAEQRVRESESRLRTVADNVPALIGHVDADLRYQFVNKPYGDWFGVDPASIVGRHMSDLLSPEEYREIKPQLDRVLDGEAVSFDMEAVDCTGALHHLHATFVPDPTPGSPLSQGQEAHAARGRGFHLMVSDVSAHKQLAKVLQERALRDELTGLPNRAAWTEELDRGMARARHGAAAAMTVMFLDLNGFKRINDRFGHQVGDAVLRGFAHRLQSSLEDGQFVARLSGDEFVVLLDQADDPAAHALAVAEKILAASRAELAIESRSLSVRPSIGIAVQTGPAFNGTELMKRADEAMYAAKRRGNGHVVLLECVGCA